MLCYVTLCYIMWCYISLYYSGQERNLWRRPPQPRRSELQEGTGSVRFVSVLEFLDNSSVRFGSVRFGKLVFPVRRGSACVFRTRRGSVWFDSVRFRVRFRPVPEFNGSVRFGRFGPVSHSFLSFKAGHWNISFQSLKRFLIPFCINICLDVSLCHPAYSQSAS